MTFYCNTATFCSARAVIVVTFDTKIVLFTYLCTYLHTYSLRLLLVVAVSVVFFLYGQSYRFSDQIRLGSPRELVDQNFAGIRPGIRALNDKVKCRHVV